MMQATKANNPLSQLGILNTEKPKKFENLNILFHGDGGMGKTSICASACLSPETAPVLVCDFEGGAPIRFAHCPEGTYTIVRITAIEDLNQVYEYLAKGDHPYKTVVLDSLTEIQKLGLAEFATSGNVAKTFKSSVVAVKVPEIAHWGKSALQMSMLVRFFRDLPMNVLFTTLTQTVKDEITGKITLKVALPGKQADEVPGIPDIVGYVTTEQLGVGKQQRVILFQPDGKTVAKDRTDALPPKMVFEKDAPIIPMLLQLVKEKNAEK